MQATFMKEDELIQSAKEVFDIEANSIMRLKERQGQEFVEAINILYGSKGKVVVTGMGKSGLIGRKIAATLCSTGTPAVFLHPAESTHGDSGIITRDDVVIGISNSGETGELLNLLPLIKRFGVPLIGMTGKMDSTLAKRSDVVLDVSVEREACPLNKAPTASTTVTLAMGDAQPSFFSEINFTASIKPRFSSTTGNLSSFNIKSETLYKIPFPRAPDG